MQCSADGAAACEVLWISAGLFLLFAFPLCGWSRELPLGVHVQRAFEWANPYAIASSCKRDKQLVAR